MLRIYNIGVRGLDFRVWGQGLGVRFGLGDTGVAVTARELTMAKP